MAERSKVELGTSRPSECQVETLDDILANAWVMLLRLPFETHTPLDLMIRLAAITDSIPSYLSMQIYVNSSLNIYSMAVYDAVKPYPITHI